MITHNAHIAEVYMCFLPFQSNQWIPTQDEKLNQFIRQWYEGAQKITDASYITIELGNPKRYTMEQILLLNQRIQEALDQHEASVTIDLQVPEKYFDKKALQLIYWTVKMHRPDHQIIGFDDDIPDQQYLLKQFTRLSAEALEQLLPLSIRQQPHIEVMEYHTHDEVDYVILLQQIELAGPVLSAIAEAAVKAAVLIAEHYHHCDGTAISRSGILAEYSGDQALLFDFLHYAFQYKGLPIIINTTKDSYISVTGKPLDLSAASHFRTAAPQMELFSSKINHDKISEIRRINLKRETCQQMMDYYRHPFSVLSMPALPFFAVTEIFKQLLLTSK